MSAAPRTWALAALVFALTLALHWRTGSFEFLGYDDDVYVTENPGVHGGVSAQGLRWAFTSGHAANWHPLTWLSHQLDVELFGLDPRGHHRVNAGLHALAAALCLLALAALTGAPGRSALAAAFFALHPLRVESVAWVAERKDLLAGVLAFAALWAYAAFARRGGGARYALCLGLYALGLLAKPMLVTLPCLFLVLDAWPLGRLGPGERRARLLEKLPFFALAAASALVTLAVQRAGGALGPLAEVPFGPRLSNALRASGIYVAKSFDPRGLCVFHPHPFASAEAVRAWPSGALVGLAVGGAWLAVGVRLRRTEPYLLVGGLWFLGMLVPVLGFVQVGLQGWAERYTYLPSVGLALALAWGGEARTRARGARSVALLAALAALALLARASWRQASAWSDSRTLFEHALAVEESSVAHVELGNALEAAGELARAESHYARAAELAPRLAGPRVNRAGVLAVLGRRDEAEAELRAALDLEADVAATHAQLGALLLWAGRDLEALTHLRRARELAPAEPRFAQLVAWTLATSATAAGPEEALALAEPLVAILPAAPPALQPLYLETLAAALARLGRFDEAVQWQTRAVERLRGAARASPEERLSLYRAHRAFVRGR